MFIQHIMISAGENDFGSKLLETAPLTPLMKIVCWSFGVLTLVVNVIIKQITHEKFIHVEHLDIEWVGKKQIIIDRMSFKIDDMFQRVSQNINTKDELEWLNIVIY